MGRDPQKAGGGGGLTHPTSVGQGVTDLKKKTTAPLPPRARARARASKVCLWRLGAHARCLSSRRSNETLSVWPMTTALVCAPSMWRRSEQRFEGIAQYCGLKKSKIFFWSRKFRISSNPTSSFFFPFGSLFKPQYYIQQCEH